MGNLIKDIKLVVCDLDGTLLNDKKKITKRLIKNVEELYQEGIFFSISSGRIPGMMGLYLKQLKIEIPVVACNGAYITDLKNIVYKKIMEFKQVEDLLHKFSKNNIKFGVLTDHQCYFSHGGDFQNNFLIYNQDASAHGLNMDILNMPANLDLLKYKDITKLLAFTRDAEEGEKVKEYISQNTDFTFAFSRKNVLDIGPKNIDKGKGVEILANVLNIPLNQVCVFGDYYNDISMFEKAGLSIAMGNAVNSLKHVADYITDDNNNDGVAKAIERLILGKEVGYENKKD